MYVAKDMGPFACNQKYNSDRGFGERGNRGHLDGVQQYFFDWSHGSNLC